LRLGLEKLAEEYRPTLTIVASDGFTPWHDDKTDPNSDYIALITHEESLPSIPQWITAIIVQETEND
jgi:hypothetical protein